MVKITNDTGYSIPTKIIDENGFEIKYATALSIDFPIGGKVTANIEMVDILVEVEAQEEYRIMDFSKFPKKYLELLRTELNQYLGETK